MKMSGFIYQINIIEQLRPIFQFQIIILKLDYTDDDDEEEITELIEKTDIGWRRFFWGIY